MYRKVIAAAFFTSFVFFHGTADAVNLGTPEVISFPPASRLFLAQISMPQADPYSFFQWIGNLILLILLVGVWKRTFPPRTPALEEQFEAKGEAGKVRAETKTELSKLMDYFNERMKGISTKIDKSQGEMKSDFMHFRNEMRDRDDRFQNNYQDLIAAVGRLEGELKARRNSNA